MKIEEVVEFIESGEFKIEFKWLSKTKYAEIDFENKVIVLNVELLFAEFIMHEYIHKKYNLSGEDEEEEKVLNKLYNIKNKMSVKDIKKLGSFLTDLYLKSRGK